jgi:hypothetical protein
MKKLIVSTCIVFFSVVLFSSTAFPWGSATHAFIADQLKKRAGPYNLDEIYGAMAPDIFNYMFGYPHQSYLHDETHNNFMKMWNSAERGYEKPAVYGFVCHNDDWGADSTAHNNSLTLVPGEGYVVTKSNILLSMLEGIFISLGLDPYGADYDLCLEICHHLVEAAVDILIKDADPMIGEKIVSSAGRPNEILLSLLIEAYAWDFYVEKGLSSLDEAVGIITITEIGFRNETVTYGEALMLNYPLDIDGISQQLAYLASVAYGITIDPDDVFNILMATMSICASDFLGEILETIDYVDKQMKEHKINKKAH